MTCHRRYQPGDRIVWAGADNDDAPRAGIVTRTWNFHGADWLTVQLYGQLDSMSIRADADGLRPDHDERTPPS